MAPFFAPHCRSMSPTNEYYVNGHRSKVKIGIGLWLALSPVFIQTHASHATQVIAFLAFGAFACVAFG